MIMYDQQNSIFQQLDQNTYKSKYYSIAQWNTFITKLETLQINSQNIIRLTKLIDIIGISILDHITTCIQKLSQDKTINDQLVKRFLIVTIGKFTQEENIGIFHQLDQFSKMYFESKRKFYLGSSLKISKIDQIWNCTVKNNLEYFFEEEIQSLELNHLQYLLFKKIQYSKDANHYCKFKESSLRYLQPQIPICCRQSFYLFQDLSQQSYFSQTDLEFFSDINITADNIQLKSAVCSMLNQNGGIIFYGVRNSALKKSVIGEQVSSDKMQKIKTYLRGVMDTFYPPQIVTKKLYQSQYVPVKKLEDNSYINGTFVLRIRISKSTQKHLYHFRQKDQARIFVRNGKRIKELQVTQIYDKIRQAVLQPKSSKPIHQGNCLIPENGIQIYDSQAIPKKKKYVEKKNYTQISIIYHIKPEWPIVEKRLEEDGIYFKIQNQENSNNLIIISHNSKLDLLKKKIQQYFKELQVGQRSPYLLSVSNVIRIQKQIVDIAYLKGLAQILKYNKVLCKIKPPDIIQFEDKQQSLKGFLLLLDLKIKSRFEK